MKREPVTSSMLKSVGYDAARRILELEFQSGRVYQYFDVPAVEYEGLIAASSHGRYFLDAIEDGYRYVRVR